MYPATCTDERLNASLLRAIDRRGRFIGTAFAVLGDGTCITCDHVLRACGTLKFINALGKQFDDFQQISTSGSSDSDIALIRLLGDRELFPKPLPLLIRSNPSAFRMRTWLDANSGVVGSLPISGGVAGPTEITYSRHGRDYIGQNVLTLTGPAIRPGMSGTPLVDPTVDAVVAIVVANFGKSDIASGFGLPVSALDRDYGSRQIYERNNIEVQRFGQEPNSRAVIEIADASNHAVLMPGRAGHLFDPNRFVNRDAFSRVIDSFIESPATTLAVFGAVGTGKTTALASLTKKTSVTPNFFIRAVDISDAKSSIGALVRERIAKAFGDLPSAVPTLDALAGAGHLLVLVDGLNEPRLDRGALLDQWLPDAIDTLGAAGAKLIFTARSEFKDAVLAREYSRDFFDAVALARQEDPEAPDFVNTDRAFFLGFYTASELTRARAIYGLSQGPDDPEFAHPLTLRLAAEAGAATGGFPQRHYFSRRLDALKQLFDRLVQRVLERSGVSHRAHVISLCERLAKEAAGSANQQVSISNHFSQLDEKVFSGLLQENVIEATPTGFRFFLDALLDYLISLSLDLVTEVHRVVAPGFSEIINRDVIALVVARRIAGNGLEEVSTALRSLIDAMPDQCTPLENPDGQLRLIVELADWVAVSTPPVPRLLAVKNEYLKRRLPSSFLGFSEEFSERAVYAFNADQLLMLIREFMLETDGYGWRRKDIEDASRRPLTRNLALIGGGVFGTVSRLFETAPKTALCILVDLLGDRARLSHNNRRGESAEATVGSLSACLIYAHFPKLKAHEIWRQVVQPPMPFGGILANALAYEFPDETLELVESDLANQEPGAFANSVVVMETILTRTDAAEFARRIAATVKDLSTRPNDRGEWPLFILSRRPELNLPPELTLELATRYYDRTGSMAAIVECAIDGALSLDEGLAQTLRDGTKTEIGFWREMLSRLTFRNPPPCIVLKQTLSALRARLASSVADWDFAHDLERLLYSVDLETATETGLLSIVEACIARRDPELSRNFVYFAIPCDRPERMLLAVQVQQLLSVQPVPDEI